MNNFELIVLCLMIPIMYVVIYMAGRADVIGYFIKISMRAEDARKKVKDTDDIRKRAKYVIKQFAEARKCALLKKDPKSLIRAEVLQYVIEILKEDLLMEDVEE